MTDGRDTWAIICAILAGYALILDLRAMTMYVKASSIHDFQVLPAIVWAGIVALTAVIYFIIYKKQKSKEYRYENKEE